jgi:hypothetical protein
MQGISALYEITYLPERLFAFLHYINKAKSLGASGTDFYFSTLSMVTVAFLFVRIVIFLLLAVIFWNCAPWVERILLPERER